jgi:hypothetical protein
MLAEGEHPRLRRRTVVIQQGVDTRAERGHDGGGWRSRLSFQLSPPLPVMPADAGMTVLIARRPSPSATPCNLHV